MVTWRLLAGLAFGIGSAALFAYAGRVQLRRPVTGEPRLALNLFATWWFALAAVTILGAAFNLLAGFGVTDLALWQVFTYVAIAGICLALWGLLYYLLYLFTGQRAWLPILSVFYIAVFVLVLYAIEVQNPIGVEVESWAAEVEYEHTNQIALNVALLLVIVLPQILAGLAYFTLFFRVHDRAQRYRIAMVSWAIIAWFTTPILGLRPGLRETDFWQLTTRTIGLIAATLVVMAYEPPGMIRRWLVAGSPETARVHGTGPKDPVRKTKSLTMLVQGVTDPLVNLFRPHPVGALF